MSNGVAPSSFAFDSTWFAGTKKNSACGSTNLWMSHGQATRSTLTFSRVIHFMIQFGSQPSHRKRLKTAENKGFLTFLNAMGRSVPLKTPIRFQIANKINGFVHVSYGTALNSVGKCESGLRAPQLFGTARYSRSSSDEKKQVRAPPRVG